MNQRRTFDQITVTKYSLLLALGLFAVGVIGHTLVPLLFGKLPAWEQTLFTDFEIVGIVLAVISVFGFGILWPLVK